MQIDIKLFIGLIAGFSFIISIWRKPKLPLKVLFISVFVFFLAFLLQHLTPIEKRFLPINDSFILLEEKKNEDIYHWQSYSFLYGTDMKIDEVRKYYWSLAEQKNIIDKIADFIPGGEFYNRKAIHEYGSIEEGGLLLDFQYGINDSATIDIVSPSTFRKAKSYQTAIFIQYSISRFSSIKTWLVLMPITVLTAILWMWIQTRFIETLKESFSTLRKPH